MCTSFDCIADAYDKTRGLPDEAMSQVVEVIFGELNNRGRILDAGVGTGRFAKPLGDRGLEIVGVDISGKMLKKAKQKNLENLLKSDVRCLPFKNNSFGASLSIHVLHLISEWETALREICRVTTEKMVSLLHVHRDPVRQAYSAELEKLGYSARRIGKGEWDLRDIVKPRKSVFAATYDNKADDYLIYLSERAFSSQWQIPEDVNEKIVGALKDQFEGKAFSQELRVLVWEIEDLKSGFS